MLFTKSVLHVEKNSKSYSLLCDPDSNLYDVKSSLLEMLGYIQSVIDQAEKKAAEESAKPEVVVPEVVA